MILIKLLWKYILGVEHVKWNKEEKIIRQEKIKCKYSRLVLDGFEGTPYKRVHKVRLFRGVFGGIEAERVAKVHYAQLNSKQLVLEPPEARIWYESIKSESILLTLPVGM